jgi:cardiolipin synthase A/B
MNYFVKISIVSILISSFSHASSNRFVASTPDRGTSVEVLFYDKFVEFSFLEDQIEYLENRLANTKKPSRSQLNQISNLKQKRDQLGLEVEALKAQYNRSQISTSMPSSRIHKTTRPWRHHYDQLMIQNIESYEIVGNVPKKVFKISTDNAVATTLILRQSHFSNTFSGEAASSQNQLANKALISRIKCNSEFEDLGTFGWSKQAQGTFYEFLWFDDKRNDGFKNQFRFNNPQTECVLLFSEKIGSKVYGVRIQPEFQELAAIGNPQRDFEICRLPKNDNQSGMNKYFSTDFKDNMTCPIKIEEFKTLEILEDGINEKIKALTGSSLSKEYLENRDPFAPLDFSKAPNLDAILISYLVFRSDFSGNVILQALKHHAERGAIIRIAVSEVITLNKDRQQLLDFQSRFPNVKLHFFKYKAKGLGFRDWLGQFHRTNHIKVFLTHSKSDPNANVVIFGGRNIHDGFLFDQPNANYIYPTLVDYREGGDESWAHWEDFETLFRSPDLVKVVMGQFFSVLHADAPTTYNRSYTLSLPSDQELDPSFFNLKDNQALIRSFTSIPYKDGMRLEQVYVQMIDSAQNEIKISTPYFHLTENLFNALIRAVQRGVQIELVTRLELKGDTADIVLGDVNKAAVNSLFDKIKIYEFTTVGKILHSKLFIIDGKFVMMGSVNLNKRSFYHDIENSTLIYSPAYAKQLKVIYANYQKESKLITEKQKTSFWKRILIGAFETEL